MHTQINPRVIQEIEKADALIYGMGSLYTIICPIICLHGMGELVATREVPKVWEGVCGCVGVWVGQGGSVKGSSAWLCSFGA